MSDVKLPNQGDGASSGSRTDEILYALSRKYGRTFLLLDRFRSDPLEGTLAELDPPPASLPLDDPVFKKAPQHAPLLLELKHKEPAHLDLLERSIVLSLQEARDLSRPPAICGWIYTEVSLERLRVAMRNRLDAGYPHGERIYLRYFDPRTLPRLAQLLGANAPRGGGPTFADLLGPICTWCHLRRDGALIVHHHPQTSPGNLAASLRFDKETADAIDRVGAINRTIRSLLANGIPHQRCDETEVDTHLVVAKSLGLEKENDRIAYARWAVQFGAAFTLHPQLQEWLAFAAESSVMLESVLSARFVESAWDASPAHESTPHRTENISQSTQ